MGSGVYLRVSHASHPKRAYPGLPSFRGSPVCMPTSVDAEPNDQIQHGNTCGEGRYYVRHAIASAQFLVLLANYVYIYSLIIRKNYDFFLLVCFNSPFELCLGTSQTCIKSSNSQVQVKSTSFKSKSKTAKTTWLQAQQFQVQVLNCSMSQQQKDQYNVNVIGTGKSMS